MKQGSDRLGPAVLLELLGCHSTPGDEGEVRAMLERHWRAAGWRAVRLGDYAVVAEAPAARGRRKLPTLLITAHMDSPGFAVDRPGRGRSAHGLTRLGGAAFGGAAAAGVLKTATAKFAVTIRKRRAKGATEAPDFVCVAVLPGQVAPLAAALRHGDRVCFAARPQRKGDRMEAPFLDNRLGCWLLAELPRLMAGWRSRYRMVLGATACEELGGFGAAVLARHTAPDLALVLDATYEAPAQGVRLGGGPVLTLSDASVLLSPARRDELLARFAAAGVPLQTEVYNYSGTDARAFPFQGLACPVLPLLLATTGNHTPVESADLRDAESLVAGLRAIAENG